MQHQKTELSFIKTAVITLAIFAGATACAASAPAYITGALAASIILLILYRNQELQKEMAKEARRHLDSAAHLRDLFENSPDAIFLVDDGGKIIKANTCACEAVQVDKRTLLTQSINDLAPTTLRNEVSGKLQEWFAGGRQRYEGALQTADGCVVPVEMTGCLQQRGGHQALQLHVRDITLRKEAEEKIHAARQLAEDSKEMAENAQKLAERSSQSKSRFLAGMSRGIRTPLNDIVGMAQLLNEKHLTNERENYIEIIQQSSAGLLELINHVLDIAKIESGQMELLLEPFDIREMCKKFQQRFQPLADASCINLACQCQSSVPLYLIGDERLVEQALATLLDNAIKYTHQGSVMLNIECRSITPSGAGLNFQVIDTGIGIPAEKQDSLFEAGAADQRRHGEPSLGLAICKRQVELMGGVIGLDSSEGEGSTFYFNLSLPQANNSEAILALDTLLRKGARVLLVEDNKVNQKVGAAILAKAGCRVDTADNGRDAVLQIRKEHYDIMFMDCEMPVMDGFEATRKIRALRDPHCDIPIIAITANAMKDDRKKCIDSGMTDYISKPINQKQLIKLINKYAAESYTV
ncbi:response regulator [Pontiella sulfatireligans]|uniref:response regulator n=1 Tax=Pontiella sulfatireligans TaxID=2750658 RepID=UPI00109CF48F|nr:response regulator [Pontiella sulfatireligans]